MMSLKVVLTAVNTIPKLSVAAIALSERAAVAESLSAVTGAGFPDATPVGEALRASAPAGGIAICINNKVASNRVTTCLTPDDRDVRINAGDFICFTLLFMHGSYVVVVQQ
jgi:hypothetical protein